AGAGMRKPSCATHWATRAWSSGHSVRISTPPTLVFLSTERWAIKLWPSFPFTSRRADMHPLTVDKLVKMRQEEYLREAEQHRRARIAARGTTPHQRRRQFGRARWLAGGYGSMGKSSSPHGTCNAG